MHAFRLREVLTCFVDVWTVFVCIADLLMALSTTVPHCVDSGYPAEV